MHEFWTNFLNEDWASVPGAPRFHVAAFGKHPGWNDHIDDIGIKSESLVLLKRMVYTQGISSQIDGAVWDRLPEDQRLPGFEHLFLWHRPGEQMLGRMWPSRDGKGRDRYPMVVAVHSIGQPLSWVWSEVAPRLEVAAQGCRAAQETIGVMHHLAQLLKELKLALPRPEAAPGPHLDSRGFDAWSAHFQAHREHLFRIYHHLHTHFEDFAPGRTDLRAAAASEESATRSRRIRLPALGATPAETLNAWLAFVLSELDPAVPFLLLLPLDQAWVDLIVGEPAAADFFVLRAGTKAVPLVTEVPYVIDERLRERLASKFDEITLGGVPTTSSFNGEAVVDNFRAGLAALERVRPGGRGFLGRLVGRFRSDPTRVPWAR